MSREDVHEDYRDRRGEVEVVELGIDHNGDKQWYLSTREGWHEVGRNGQLIIDKEYCTVGTRIEVSEVVE